MKLRFKAFKQFYAVENKKFYVKNQSGLKRQNIFTGLTRRKVIEPILYKMY